MGIMGVMDWIVYLFATLGLFDCYIAYRFLRKGKGVVDQTAGFLSYWFVKWTLTTQTKLVAKAMPFVSKDLTEWLGIRKDDGNVS